MATDGLAASRPGGPTSMDATTTVVALRWKARCRQADRSWQQSAGSPRGTVLVQPGRGAPDGIHVHQVHRQPSTARRSCAHHARAWRAGNPNTTRWPLASTHTNASRATAVAERRDMVAAGCGRLFLLLTQRSVPALHGDSRAKYASECAPKCGSLASRRWTGR